MTVAIYICSQFSKLLSRFYKRQTSSIKTCDFLSNFFCHEITFFQTHKISDICVDFIPVLGVMISSKGFLARTSICKEQAKCDKDQIRTVESREQDATVNGLNL